MTVLLSVLCKHYLSTDRLCCIIGRNTNMYFVIWDNKRVRSFCFAIPLNALSNDFDVTDVTVPASLLLSLL